MTMCMCFPVTALAEQEIPSETGKITIIHNGEKTVKDFRDCITIYDEKGNVVPFAKTTTRSSYSKKITLKNGYSFTFDNTELAYNTQIDVYASCSVGNVGKLRLEALRNSSDGTVPIAQFQATQGQWYGHASGRFLMPTGGVMLDVHNIGSETVVIDSLTWYY